MFSQRDFKRCAVHVRPLQKHLTRARTILKVYIRISIYYGCALLGTNGGIPEFAPMLIIRSWWLNQATLMRCISGVFKGVSGEIMGDQMRLWRTINLQAIFWECIFSITNKQKRAQISLINLVLQNVLHYEHHADNTFIWLEVYCFDLNFKITETIAKTIYATYIASTEGLYFLPFHTRQYFKFISNLINKNNLYLIVYSTLTTWCMCMVIC